MDTGEQATWRVRLTQYDDDRLATLAAADGDLAAIAVAEVAQLGRGDAGRADDVVDRDRRQADLRRVDQAAHPRAERERLAHPGLEDFLQRIPLAVAGVDDPAHFPAGRIGDVRALRKGRDVDRRPRRADPHAR